MEAKRGRSPQVQRPMILDVLPADVAPRLDKLPNSFNRKLRNHVPKVLRHWWVWTAGLVIVGAAVISWHFWFVQTPKLPAKITNQIAGFEPYFFTKLPTGFQFNSKNVSYGEGVLFFQLLDKNNESVVISEQPLPTDFAKNAPQGQQTVDGVDGTASVSNRDGRTIATFVTNKKPSALISLSADGTVDAATLKRILLALKPY
ncbi:MAG TPA: hypothetical protein VJR27_03010 [Candidatus Saccharimonadales bacterium]|nr:hypothetical protein [Candidatus Saccharimonadales bacterium]